MHSQRSRNRPTWPAFALVLAAAVSLASCNGSTNAVSPSTLVGDPSKYDGQTVTVTGTARVRERNNARAGAARRFRLCDTDCINVVQFGGNDVKEGSSLTLTGRFRAGETNGARGSGAAEPSGTRSSEAFDMNDSSTSETSRRGHHRRHHRRPTNVLIVGGQ